MTLYRNGLHRDKNAMATVDEAARAAVVLYRELAGKLLCAAALLESGGNAALKPSDLTAALTASVILSRTKAH